MYRYWIFDLDGTLADTSQDIIDSLAVICESLLGRKPALDSSWIGPPLSDMIRRIEPGVSSGQIAQITQLFREKYMESGFSATSLYPGIVDVLSSLRQQRFLLYVATNKSMKLTKAILGKAGILSMFQGIWTSDALGGVLSKEQMVRELVSFHGTVPAETILVGDSPADIRAALDNGSVAAAAGWGYGNKQAIIDENPNYYFYTVQELRQWITSEADGLNFPKVDCGKMKERKL